MAAACSGENKRLDCEQPHREPRSTSDEPDFSSQNVVMRYRPAHMPPLRGRYSLTDHASHTDTPAHQGD